MRRVAPAFVPALLGLLLLGPRGHAAEVDVDPGARTLLDEVIRAYHALPAYADQGKLTINAEVDGHETRRESALSVSFMRPNRLDLQWPMVRLVSDGKNIRTSVAPLKSYRDIKAPATLRVADLENGPAGDLLFDRSPAEVVARVLLALLLDEEPTATLFRDAVKVRLEDDREIEGRKLRVVGVERSGEPSYRLRIDPTTKLLAGVEVRLPGKGTEGKAAKLAGIDWTPGVVKTDPRADEAFPLAVPAGYHPVASLADAAKPEAEQAKEPPHPLMGKPAPAVKWTVLEDEGKTRIGVPADLAGQVVLLDFWATWCGPCLKEMPDVAELAVDLGRAKKPVRIVALSIDDAAGGVPETRKLIEDTLKERKIDLRKGPVGMIALDASGDAARLFQVEAIPTLVLLDKEGKVRAVHVGVTERETLEAEIEQLLQGKPLGEPSDAAKKPAAR